MSQVTRMPSSYPQAEPRYSADIIAGALMVPESRVIADLLLRGVTEADWKDAIAIRNVLKLRDVYKRQI